jgi:hypothetical protein
LRDITIANIFLKAKLHVLNLFRLKLETTTFSLGVMSFSSAQSSVKKANDTVNNHFSDEVDGWW